MLPEKIKALGFFHIMLPKFLLEAKFLFLPFNSLSNLIFDYHRHIGVILINASRSENRINRFVVK